jgi:hypothetical protein
MLQENEQRHTLYKYTMHTFYLEELNEKVVHSRVRYIPYVSLKTVIYAIEKSI